MRDLAIGLLVLAVLVAANGFFVAAESSLVTVDRIRVDRLAESGDRPARAVRQALQSLTFQLSGTQLGITLSSLAVGFLAEPALSRAVRPALRAVDLPASAVEPGAVTLSLALATAVQMVLGELVPKNWAIASPLEVARRLARPQLLLSAAFRPVVRLLNGAANRLVRRLGIEPQEELRSAHTPDELELLAASSAEVGTLDRDTALLLRRALRFPDKAALDVLTPRVRLVTLREEDTVRDLFAAARASGHSRFPVHSGEVDDVTGVVHVKAGLAVPERERDRRRMADLAVPAVVVPATLDLDSLLDRLRDRDSQLAVVVDEYGGTAGIVTLEDLVEEIVGEVADEYDHPGEPVGDVVGEPADDGQAAQLSRVVSGLLHADELAEQLGFRLPAGPYETLGGLLLSRLGRLPVTGDVVEVDGWRLEVARLDRHRVDLVELSPAVRTEAGA